MASQVKRFASDLWLTWDLIFASLLIMTVSAYLITYLLSEPAVVLYEIWIAVWGSLMCFAVLAYMFWREYERVIRQRCLFGIDKHGCGGQRALLFQYMCYSISFVGFTYLLYVMRLFNRINLGIGLIKAASKVIFLVKSIDRCRVESTSLFRHIRGLLWVALHWRLLHDGGVRTHRGQHQKYSGFRH